MQKVHGHVLETRDACVRTGTVGKSAQIALATKGFLDSQTGLALLICRARDVARTTRDTRHDHGTGTVQRRNVS